MKKEKLSQEVFSNLINVRGTYLVDLTIEWPREVVYKHFSLVCFVFNGAAPIYFIYRQPF